MAWTDAARAAAAMARKHHGGKGGYVGQIQKVKGSTGPSHIGFGTHGYSLSTAKAKRAKNIFLNGTRSQADSTVKKIVARSGGGSIRRLG